MNEIWCDVGFRCRSTQPTDWYKKICDHVDIGDDGESDDLVVG